MREKLHLVHLFSKKIVTELKVPKKINFQRSQIIFFLPKFSKFNDQVKKELDDNFGSRKNFAQK